MKPAKTIIIVFIALVMVFSYKIAVAASDLPAFRVDFSIPCLLEGVPGFTCPDPTASIANYIIRLFQFVVGIAGILAVGAMVVGAIQYAVSAGSPDRQREAKDRITSALWGIALLLGSILILNTINPEITALRLRTPHEINVCEEGETPTKENPCIKRYQTDIAQFICFEKITNTSCQGQSGNELIECRQAQNLDYTRRLNECSNQYKDFGGGGFIYKLGDQNFQPQCYPFYRLKTVNNQLQQEKNEQGNPIINQPPAPPDGQPDKSLKWC